MARRSPASTTSGKRGNAGKALARSVHHLAFRCRDAEQTRQFRETGCVFLPLVIDGAAGLRSS